MFRVDPVGFVAGRLVWLDAARLVRSFDRVSVKGLVAIGTAEDTFAFSVALFLSFVL